MWLERILIIWNTLSHGYLPTHVAAVPSDPLGLAAAVRAASASSSSCSCSSCRLVPAVSMYEVRSLCHRGGRWHERTPLLAEFARSRRPARGARAASRRRRLRGARCASRPSRSRAGARRSASRRRASACAMLLGRHSAWRRFAYWLQWYSAVIDYPLNVGGRPLNSWPVFLLVPVRGRDARPPRSPASSPSCWRCGLPRLHHPVFDVARLRAREPGPLLPARRAGRRPTGDSSATLLEGARRAVGHGGEAVRLRAVARPRRCWRSRPATTSPCAQQKRYDVLRARRRCGPTALRRGRCRRASWRDGDLARAEAWQPTRRK